MMLMTNALETKTTRSASSTERPTFVSRDVRECFSGYFAAVFAACLTVHQYVYAIYKDTTKFPSDKSLAAT